MNTSAEVAASRRSSLTTNRAVWLGSIVFFGFMPVLVLLLLVTEAWDRSIAIDLHQFVNAAQAILDGQSPYPPNGEPTTFWGGPYPYPPLPALLAVVLTTLPFHVAGLLVMSALVLAAVATLWLIGVRDWRCYGLALMWPPVISAIQTGNLTLWLALACALAWRFRDRLLIPSASIGITLAAKFFLWPVVVWLAVTRRMLSALVACAIGAAVLLASWAVIGFAGMSDYPHLLQRLEEVVGEDSYTLYIVGLDAGIPSPAARVLWAVVGLSLVACTAALALRGDEKTSFIMAVAASLALTPIVWLHYFALLLVPVALARPYLGVMWFVPLALIATPGSGHPQPRETAWTLCVVVVTIALAVRASRLERMRERQPAPQGAPAPAEPASTGIA